MASFQIIVKRTLPKENGGPRNKFYLWNETGDTQSLALEKAKADLRDKFPDDELVVYAVFELKGDTLQGSAMTPQISLSPFAPQMHVWSIEDLATWKFKCQLCGKIVHPKNGEIPREGRC